MTKRTNLRFLLAVALLALPAAPSVAQLSPQVRTFWEHFSLEPQKDTFETTADFERRKARWQKSLVASKTFSIPLATSQFTYRYDADAGELRILGATTWGGGGGNVPKNLPVAYFEKRTERFVGENLLGAKRLISVRKEVVLSIAGAMPEDDLEVALKVSPQRAEILVKRLHLRFLVETEAPPHDEQMFYEDKVEADMETSGLERMTLVVWAARLQISVLDGPGGRLVGMVDLRAPVAAE